MNDMALATQQEALPIPVSGSMFFDVAKFEHAQRVATMLSTSTIVPEHFRKNLGNCIIALNLAERMRVDPFMLMQTMYVIHGKPGIEGKLAIALINGSKKFTPLQYKKTGAENSDERTYVAHATHQETGEDCEGPAVSIGMAKSEGWHGKNGSKWKTMPELMLAYRSAMFFARTYCPEVLLGLQTKDELDEMVVDMHPNSNGAFIAEPTEPVTYTAEKIENNEEPLEVDMTTDEKPDQEPEDPKTLYDEFKNLRSKDGVATYFWKNKDRIEKEPEDVQLKLKEKWEKYCEGQPWPLVVVGQETTDPFTSEVDNYRSALDDETVDGVLLTYGEALGNDPKSVKEEFRGDVLNELKRLVDTK